MKTVKVKYLRTVDTGDKYHIKGTHGEIPEEQAKAWSKGPKPAVEIVKG